MKYTVTLIAFLIGISVSAETVVLTYGTLPEDAGDYRVVDVSRRGALEDYSVRTGTRVGVFPALVNERLRIWVSLADGLESAEETLAQRAQLNKPQAQKTYENAFFDLIDELLVLVDDPQDPTPKLGFPELQAFIAQVQSVDPMTAVNLSLNLLTIDAALKRYDTMWWDNAVRHDLEEE